MLTSDPPVSEALESQPVPAVRVLVVEDDQVIRGLLAVVLEREGYAVEFAVDGDDGLRALQRELYDLVLLDLNLPGKSGLEVLAAARSSQTDAQFVVLTGQSTVDTAVEAMRLGAYDYLSKPFSPSELLLALRRALETTSLRREVARLLRQTGSLGRGEVVGRSPALRVTWDLIERVAPTRASVLVTGETGTGKELVARAIHRLSPRSAKPFVPVNCSALPETLLESELFGHVKGSFTGAIANRRGLFEEAAGGTLFLDEVATLAPATQVRLLRVLQERTVQRIGGGPPVPVDFRLVAAANVDLADEVAAGRFREDLFYRFSVFPIRVPPLRERPEDIPLLAEHFRARFADEHGIEPPPIAADALARMREYPWPGNVRELENYIERACIRYAGARTLPFDLARPAPDGSAAEPPGLLEHGETEGWSLDRLEREYIERTLRRLGGHRVRAAEALGIDRRTLHRKLKQWEDEGTLGSIPDPGEEATGSLPA